MKAALSLQRIEYLKEAERRLWTAHPHRQEMGIGLMFSHGINSHLHMYTRTHRINLERHILLYYAMLYRSINIPVDVSYTSILVYHSVIYLRSTILLNLST